MPWQKGQCGNPKGAPPKAITWAKIIDQVGKEKDVITKRSNKQAVVEAMYRQAKAGNVQAARLIMEVLDGAKLKGDFNVRFGWIGENGEDHNSPI
jgi:hypothetical protein